MIKLSIFFVSFLFTSTLFITELSANKSAHEHREHRAHEHGSGKINLAVDKNSFEIEIDSPAADFLGFEHIAKTASEKKLVKETHAFLKDVNNIFFIPSEAKCKTLKSEIEGEGPSHKEHSDIEVSYNLQCEQPDKLKGLKIKLFSKFKGIKKLQVQSVVGDKQSSATLKSDSESLPGF